MSFNELNPPGELIKVNGRIVHVQRSGTGSPTVVLESGWYDDSLMFNGIQTEIAKFSNVISYDRAGMGWSDISPNPKRVSCELASELFELLKELNVDTSLVMAGWSIGGIYVRDFANQHPEMVAGMVLIDSSHENQDNRFPKDIMSIFNRNHDEFIKMLTARSQMTHEQILFLNKLSSPPRWHRRPPATHKYYEDRERPELYKNLVHIASYREDIVQGDSALKPLGDIPLMILSTIQKDNPDLNYDQNARLAKVWGEMQSELAALSTESRIIVVDGGHDIVTENPQIVIDAIQEVVLRVREISK